MHIWNIWYLEVFIYYHSFMYIVCTKWKKKLINLMGINALIKERIMILGYLCDCRLPKREKHTRGSSIDVMRNSMVLRNLIFNIVIKKFSLILSQWVRTHLTIGLKKIISLRVIWVSYDKKKNKTSVIGYIYYANVLYIITLKENTLR